MIFFNDKMRKILYTLDLQNVIQFYSTSKNVSNILSHRKRNKFCATDCKYCHICKTQNSCFMKFIIYKITCKFCKCHYIGQTSRFFKTRIKEHINRSESAIFKHLSEFHVNCNFFDIFVTEVLHANLHNDNMRTHVESIYISKFSDSLMNGCMSVAPLSFSCH